jgi:CheY-like chemotaxis protein
VDDSADMADSTAILLRLWGYEARTTNDGEAALRLAGEWMPHVALIDLAMPGMNGWDVAKRLKQIPGLEGVLLMAVTGCSQPKDFQRSVEAGFTRHILKPFDPNKLRRLLPLPAAQ